MVLLSRTATVLVLPMLLTLAFGAQSTAGIDNDRAAELAGKEAGVRAEPGLAASWYERGLTLRRMHRYADAINDFTKAIEIEPSHAEALAARSLCRTDLSEKSEAVTDASQAIKIDPDLPEAILAFGVATSRAVSFEEGMKDIQRAVGLRPEEAMFLRYLANALVTDGQYREAESICRKALTLEPTFGLAHYVIASTEIAKRSQGGNSLDIDQIDLGFLVEHYREAFRLDRDLVRVLPPVVGDVVLLAAISGRDDELAEAGRLLREFGPEALPAIRQSHDRIQNYMSRETDTFVRSYMRFASDYLSSIITDLEQP